MFWPLTVRKKCSSEKLLKFKAEGRKFAKDLNFFSQKVRTILETKYHSVKNIHTFYHEAKVNYNFDIAFTKYPLWYHTVQSWFQAD